jgi:5-deoxy-glucuronate isomerase
MGSSTVNALSPPQPLDTLFDVAITGRGDVVCSASPSSAGWRFVTFAAVELAAACEIELATGDREIAIVPLQGAFHVAVGGQVFTVSRTDVFAEAGSVVYLPPGVVARITALVASNLAIGGAPAEARYPVRHITADAIRAELRGGGAARRQVAHLLAPPIEAHRLILYEVHVPRGSWSGWPPHCHDGEDGSPYLEETYYFEHQPPSGFAMHRNFRDATGFDQSFVAPHRSVVTVPAGYHSSAACPGSHMYFLNYLAGELEHEARRTPPCFDERYTWIDGRWDDDPMTLPTAGRGE